MRRIAGQQPEIEFGDNFTGQPVAELEYRRFDAPGKREILQNRPLVLQFKIHPTLGSIQEYLKT